MGIIQDGLELAKLAGRIANPELMEKVTQLNAHLLELSGQNVEFKKLIDELENELREANAKLTLVGEVERRNGYVYRTGDIEPHCTRCFDVDHRLVHLTYSVLPKQGRTVICPECETAYFGSPEGMMGRTPAAGQ